MIKSYKDAVMALIENPKYNSDWIDVSAKLISEFGYATDFLEKFDPDQLNIIYNANKSFGEDVIDPDQGFINALSNPALNCTQMEILLKGKQQGADISKYINPKLAYSKLNYLIQSLLDGYDIAEYYNVEELTAGQIYELYAAHKSNVDISPFFNPNNTYLTDDAMAVIRHALELGLNVEYDVENDKIIIG